jgi:hypothetical protein
MGILGIPHNIQMIGCTHILNSKACWIQKGDDGSAPPDLWFKNFPTDGRMVLFNQTIVLACWACKDSIDVIVTEYGKTFI